MKQLILNTFLVASLLTSVSITAQEVRVAEGAKSKARLPYEVIITPNVTRTSLRLLIVEVEEDFAERFNELNLDDDYDVLCYMHTPTMSHRRQQICEPEFLIRTRADDASIAAFILSSNDPYRYAYAEVQNPVQMRSNLKPQYEIFQSKLEEAARGDTQLRSMLAALSELTEQMNDFRKE